MDKLTGKHFEIEGKKLTIGGQDGVFAFPTDEGEWCIYHPIFYIHLGRIPVVSPKEDELATILGYIAQDEAAGRKHLIEEVWVGWINILRLWLQGVVTAEHFAQAVETDTYVLLPAVKFGDNTYPLRITSIADEDFAATMMQVEGEWDIV